MAEVRPLGVVVVSDLVEDCSEVRLVERDDVVQAFPAAGAGAAAALREAIGVPLRPTDRAVHDRGLAAARAGLGEAAFAIAWAAGRAMPLEQAVADALEEAGAG